MKWINLECVVGGSERILATYLGFVFGLFGLSVVTSAGRADHLENPEIPEYRLEKGYKPKLDAVRAESAEDRCLF